MAFSDYMLGAHALRQIEAPDPYPGECEDLWKDIQNFGRTRLYLYASSEKWGQRPQFWLHTQASWAPVTTTLFCARDIRSTIDGTRRIRLRWMTANERTVGAWKAIISIARRRKVRYW